MVLPFPTETWLEIFKGLLEEGEYDTLERCRVVCREFRPMARECLGISMAFGNVDGVERIKVDVSGGRLPCWGGPQRVSITGGNGEEGRRPIPHLATFASRISIWTPSRVFSITNLVLRDVIFPSILTLGRLLCALPRLKELTLHDIQFTQHPFDASTISHFRLLPRTQLDTLVLGHGYSNTELKPSFVELVDLMAAVGNRRCPVPPPNLAQVSPWSSVRALSLGHVMFPSVTTFARLLCALPGLKRLQLVTSCTFAKHGFDLRSVPAHPGLPLLLADVDLADDFRLHSDPCSVADLVDVFVATGLSENLRRITICLSSSSRVTTGCDAALSRLVKHSAQSLHHLSLDSSSYWWISSGADELLHANHSAASYFDVSENTCLEHLDLKIQVTHANMSHLCASLVEILSQVTSTHISVIQVNFSPYYRPGAELDVDLRNLMDGLPQLDAVLSRPIFNNLTDIAVHIRTLDGSNIRDQELAHAIRLCLPTLDARGILDIGMHWDYRIRAWKRFTVNRVSAQDAVVTNQRANGEGRRGNASTGAIPHVDSEFAPSLPSRPPSSR
ncbi:predicted protein [Postia placenta Mad-698-R]|nr:predicted protein [Postia placenta Mad-698-R]